MKKLYLVIVLGDVEPILAGPFETEQMRDDHAAMHRELEGDKDGIYKLDINNMPSISAYPASFFMEPEGE